MRYNNLLLSVVLSTVAMAAQGADEFLLPNGDFRYSGGARFLLERWQPHSWDEKNTITVAFPHGERKPGVLTLEQNTHRILMYQDFLLLPGEYEVEVELTVATGKAQIQVGNLNLLVDADAGKRQHSKGTLVVDKAGEYRLHLATAANKTLVHFYHVALTIQKLYANENSEISAIVLPEKPSPAERFASWELQCALWKMTKAFPGVKNRDVIKPSKQHGIEIHIGHTADSRFQKSAAELISDGYCYGNDAQGNLHLCGQNDRGTLYAVYEFLKQQGFAWITLGKTGEVVPPPKALKLTFPDTKREPAYVVRGFMEHLERFRLDNGWENEDFDAICDWALHNGWNAFWCATDVTMDMRDWRGGSILQTLNHSWHLFLRDDHPEWFPMVKGKRLKYHISGRPNLLCVSNPELHKEAARYIIKFFREHPDYKTFGLSADDEPAFWCECPECRKLDPDDGKGAWITTPDGLPQISMTDRSLYFVNHVAELVSKEFPDHQIEMFAYMSLKKPPVKLKVHPNVKIKYCYWPEQEWNRLPDMWKPLDKPDNCRKELLEELNGWRKAGANHMSLYDYDNHIYSDTTWGAFRWSFESMSMFQSEFGFDTYMGQTTQLFYGNPLMGYLRGAALWGYHSNDFDKLVSTFCRQAFGHAAKTMEQYYRELDRRFREGFQNNMKKLKKPKPIYRFVDCTELTWADYDILSNLLKQAWQEAGNDENLRIRLAKIQLAHNLSILAKAVTAKDLTEDKRMELEHLQKTTKQLYNEYRLNSFPKGVNQLNMFYLPPAEGTTLLELPETWRFQPDLEQRGDAEQWFHAAHPAWVPISVTRDWTTQGFEFHGTGWYEVEFTTAKLENCHLYFKAVDGIADVYWDGIWIGEQKKDPGHMWDRAFSIKLPDISAGKHRLTVKVTKQECQAGIWKPVKIVTRL